MWQFLGIMLLLAAAVVAIKVAILLLFLAGLIFRTKETVALIGVLGALALVRDYTLYCIVVAPVMAPSASTNGAPADDPLAITPTQPCRASSDHTGGALAVRTGVQ